MASYSDRLSALFVEGGALREIWRADGMAWIEMKVGKPEITSKVPFGYTDGISMTTIRGGPERYPRDHQQPCEPWLFVLRDDAENYLLPEQRELGLNGSFAVFKVISTDVVGFENFLQSNKEEARAPYEYGHEVIVSSKITVLRNAYRAKSTIELTPKLRHDGRAMPLDCLDAGREELGNRIVAAPFDASRRTSRSRAVKTRNGRVPPSSSLRYDACVPDLQGTRRAIFSA